MSVECATMNIRMKLKARKQRRRDDVKSALSKQNIFVKEFHVKPLDFPASAPMEREDIARFERRFLVNTIGIKQFAWKGQLSRPSPHQPCPEIGKKIF